MTDLTTDLGSILENFDKRVYRLEQTVSSPAVMGGTNEFDELYIGGELLDAVPPGPPTDITVTPGVNYGEIYVDVEWVAPVDGKAASYYIELTRRTAIGPPEVFSLERVTTTVGTNYRFDGLDPNTTYSVRVEAINKIGIIGDWSAAAQFATGQDTTIPVQITGLTAGRGATSLVATYDRSPDVDVDRANGLYEVQISNNDTFTGSYLKIEFTSATVVAFTDITVEATMYVRVRAIDASGNEGPWSATVAATAGGVVDSMVVAGLDAAKITFGSMSGDRITANSMSVNRLFSSTLTTTTITMGSGGTISIGSPPTNGIFINNLGIRGYSGGSETFILDSSGTATFKGNINGASMTGSTALFGQISLDSTGINLATVPTESYSSSYAIRYTSSGSIKGRIWTYDSGYGQMYVEAIGTFGTLYLRANDVRLGSTGGSTYLSAQSGGVAVNTTLNANGKLNANSSSRSFFNVGIDVFGTSNIGGVTLASGAMGVGAIFSTVIYNTAGSGRTVTVNSGGAFGSIASTLRIKKNVRKLSESQQAGLYRKLLDVEPVLFNYKNDPEGAPDDFGLIAEWVEENLGDIAPWLIFYDNEGRPDGIKYERLMIGLLPLIRKIAERTGVLDG